jgi:hypothetical protein
VVESEPHACNVESEELAISKGCRGGVLRISQIALIGLAGRALYAVRIFKSV